MHILTSHCGLWTVYNRPLRLLGQMIGCRLSRINTFYEQMPSFCYLYTVWNLDRDIKFSFQEPAFKVSFFNWQPFCFSLSVVQTTRWCFRIRRFSRSSWAMGLIFLEFVISLEFAWCLGNSAATFKHCMDFHKDMDTKTCLHGKLICVRCQI